MSNIKLLNGDCLELMKDIPDKSIDRNFIGIELDENYFKVAQDRRKERMNNA